MSKKTIATSPDKSDSGNRSDLTAKEVAAFLVLSNKTISGIDDAIHLLISRKNSLDTPAAELRMIEFELGDQEAKKARVMNQKSAFVDNLRAIRPPSSEMSNTAEKLVEVLDKMTAANVTANQVVVTATQLFKIWQQTET